jgi:hypothetical protein
MVKRAIAVMTPALLILILIICNTSFAVHLKGVDEVEKAAYPGSEPAGDPSYAYPYEGGGRDDILAIQLGTTYYDYQTNGSTGDRIAVHECGKHFAWMNGIGTWSGNRWIYYNYMDPNGNLGWADGTQVSEQQGGGYCTLDMNSDGAAIIAFHYFNANGVRVAIDAFCGAGLFNQTQVPNTYPGQYDLFWPYVTYDNGGNIHIIVSENEPTAGNPQWMGHTYSTDGGGSWPDLELVDSVVCISGIPVSSPVDDKVAIVYTRPIVVEGQLSQIVNDVAYIESEDGVTWNYAEFVNVTNYNYMTDSVFAYTDLDACYDYNGDLHILWNAPAYWIPQEIYAIDSCLLFHWSENTGTNLVYSAWHNSIPGAWNRSASKMSISACPNGTHLYALWTNFNDSDVSQAGFSNGDLYLSTSTDGGRTWSAPENITGTETPGCLPGDCQSEHWSSMADQVRVGPPPDYIDSVHIIYIEDRDAGGIPQGEGVETENPVMYMSYPVSCPPQSGVEDGSTIPAVFELSQNYPNPFNASTNIEFELKENARIRLEVFNLLGEKIAALADGIYSAGKHTVTWNASDFTSGVYFCELTANGRAETRRMVVIK